MQIDSRNLAFRQLAEGIRAGGVKPAERMEQSTSCTDWSIKNRIIDEVPYSYKEYEYLIEPTNLMVPKFVVRKGAQLGWTESLGINRVLYGICIRRASAIYLLPTGDDVSDFSAARMGPAINDSPGISTHFTQVNNVGLKRAGAVSLYLRGSNSRSKLKSVPAGELYIDEYDEMAPEMVELARKRLSGHKLKFEYNFSTPSIPDWGIDKEYIYSDQRMYAVPCPYCAKYQFMMWPDSITWDGRDPKSAVFKCTECNHNWSLIDRAIAVAEGRWVITNHAGAYPGYWISQLYSRAMSAPEILELGIAAEDNEIKKKEFMNSVLGMAYVPRGGRLTWAELNKSKTGPPMVLSTTIGCTMGVDVGSWLYYEIARWRGKRKEVVKVGKVKAFSELNTHMNNFSIYRCVVDANPERREARRFANRYQGRVYLAFYPRSKEELKKEVAQWDDKKFTVNIARTESLDITIGRYRGLEETVVLPVDIPDEYLQHHYNTVRLQEEDDSGRTYSRYQETGPDHYLHASNYNDVAGRQTMSGYALLQTVKARGHVNPDSRSIFNGQHNDYLN